MRHLFILSFLFLFNFSNAQIQIGADIDGEAEGDYFGSSLALSSDGQFLAVGANENDGNGLLSGHVRVFQKVGTAWIQRGADIDGADGGDGSGAVDISDDGNRVVIGSRFSNANGGASGQTRVFEYNGSAWGQLGADLNGEAAFDYAGHAVAMSNDGNTIAIGATHNDGGGNDAGHTRLYSYTAGNWVQKGADIDGESAGDNSGWSVALSADGNTVVIGAYKNQANGTDAGHARVYSFSGGSWSQVGADIDGGAGDRFGWDVDISDDGYKIIIGGTHNTNSAGFEAGVARVYTNINHGPTWNKTGQDMIGESLVDWFGYSVAISGSGFAVAIGAIRNDGTGPDAGNVKVFQYPNGTWLQVGASLNAEASGDWFGTAVSLSYDGYTLAVGALNNNPSGTAPYTGQVRCFDLIGIVSSGEEIDQDQVVESFKAFPNPSNGMLTLELGRVINFVTVTISDVTGKVLFQNEFENIESTELELTDSTGVYFVKIETPNQPAKTLRVLKK